MSLFKPYNILIIHNKYRYAGGEDTVVANEAALLQEHGHRVLLYQKDNTSIKKNAVIQKLFLPFRTIFSLSSYQQVRDFIQKNHIHIVHVHNTLPLISFSVYYAAKKSGCGLVQTLHNFRFLCPNGLMYRDGHICEECTGSLKQSIRHACYRGSALQTAVVALCLWLHRKIGTFELPDAYIALTKFNKEKLSGLLNPDKVFVKPNFNLNNPHFSSKKHRDSYLYLSRLEESKGILKLLQAFSSMPDIRLDIVGTGSLEDEVRNYIAAEQLTQVTFHGQKPHTQAMELLYHAKALISPTQLYEGFPMTFSESYSLGTPVIGSNIGNTANLIEDGKTGFLYNTDCPEELKQIISKFENKDFDYKTMEENCRRTYEEQYHADRNYKLLVEIYEKSLY